MPKSKKLQKKISKKIEKLQELLDQVEEVRVIDSNDSDTWDSDALYNLVENLKEALKILEDQKIKGKYDEFGQPLYEEGLCSLVDEYQVKSDCTNIDDRLDLVNQRNNKNNMAINLMGWWISLNYLLLFCIIKNNNINRIFSDQIFSFSRVPKFLFEAYSSRHTCSHMHHTTSITRARKSDKGYKLGIDMLSGLAVIKNFYLHSNKAKRLRILLQES